MVASPVIGEEYDNAWITANFIESGLGSNRAISTYNNGTPDTDTDGEGPDTATQYWRYFQENDASTVFTTGVGYSNKRTTAGNYSFTGTFPTSDVTPAISQNNNNWNLLGNPYPSYLDIASFLTANNSKIAPAFLAIYVWNGTSYTNLTNGYLNPGQGFFIHSNVAIDVASFTEIMQSHQTENVFYKNNNPTIELIVTNGSVTKTTKIAYQNGKSLGLDPGFDVGIFDGVATDLSVYSYLVDNNEGIAFQKQTLPLVVVGLSTIPLGIKAEVGKELVFSIQKTFFPENLKVYLEDKWLNKFVLLSTKDANYNVAIKEKLNGTGRFYLHTTGKTLNSNSFNTDLLSIFKKDRTTIHISGINGNVTVKLYSVQGKKILQNSFYAQGFKEIRLPKVSAGVYIIQVHTENSTTKQKIILE